MNKKSNKNILIKLIRNYSFFLISIIIAFVLLVMVLFIHDNYNKANLAVDEVISVISNNYQQDQHKLTLLSRELFKNEDLMEPYHAYFSMDLDAYRWWNLIHSSGRENRDLSIKYRNQMAQDDSLRGIVVKFDEYDDYFYIEKGRYYGSKLNYFPNRKNHYQITKSIMSVDSYDEIGKISYFLDENRFLNAIKRNDKHQIFSVYLLDNYDNIVFSYGNEDSDFNEFVVGYSVGKYKLESVYELLPHYLVDYQLLSGNYKIVVGVLNRDIYLSNTFPVVLGSLTGFGMIIILVVLLQSMFKSYLGQVSDIVLFLENVDIEDETFVLDTADKEGEMLLISDAINTLLRDIRKSIQDIYVLEIRQKEAELSALQAQINPHFMYNTLEYIRMNVLSEGLDELSEVIYSFATLLRNNIMAEKFITLKKELDFCEKYVFLYQMRHPDRIAYHFTIEKDLEHMVLPRFIIQPLIENYLIHGLDYMRFDNAISVDAYRENDETVIVVKDNGKGIKDTCLSQLNERLANGSFSKGDSIGLLNVNGRLKHYYKGKAMMRLDHNEKQGLLIEIKIKDRDENV